MKVASAKPIHSLADRIVALIEASRQAVASAVNLAMVYTYYEIGQQIVEEEQNGASRAGYGDRLLIERSKRLTRHFGRGFSVDNLQNMRNFYLAYSATAIYETPSRKSVAMKDETPSRKSPGGKASALPKFSLSWSHYLKLLRIDDPRERAFYEIEAAKEHWSIRELQRQSDEIRSSDWRFNRKMTGAFFVTIENMV